MAVQLALWPKVQFFDNAGDPLASGKLYSYAAGTSTPLSTYSDSAGNTPNANPTILSSRGEATVYLTRGTAYKLVLKTSADVEIWTQDNILIDAAVNAGLLLPSGVALSTLSGVFTPTAGASTATLAGFHPANVLVLAMKLVVDQQFGNANGLTGLSVGDPGTIDRWGGGLTLTTGEKAQRNGGMPMFSTATAAVLSAEGGTFDGTGSATLTRLTLELE